MKLPHEIADLFNSFCEQVYAVVFFSNKLYIKSEIQLSVCGQMMSVSNSEKIITSSSAVAKRPRDASCLSVLSFVASIVQYLECSFLSRVSILTRDIDIANLSVRLSICPTVTFRYQMKTA